MESTASDFAASEWWYICVKMLLVVDVTPYCTATGLCNSSGFWHLASAAMSGLQPGCFIELYTMSRHLWQQLVELHTASFGSGGKVCNLRGVQMW